MADRFSKFERVVRLAAEVTQQTFVTAATEHPFEGRNVSTSLPVDVRNLFDNGHYSQATFEAMKFLDNEVKRHARSAKMGTDLMMQAFNENAPLIKLTAMNTESEKSEQKGYQFIFAGSMLAIRNPRGHEHGLLDDVDTCLDHLTFVSQLLRRLAEAGFK